MRGYEEASRPSYQDYSLVGQIEDALEWVENMVRVGGMNYPALSEYDPLLANVRRDPRFQRVMEKVEAEWEAFDT